MTEGVTLEEVTTVADRLLKAGDRPSVDRIRRELGRGAPGTVSRHLSDYYRGLELRVRMPAPLVVTLMRMAEKQRTEAEQAAAKAYQQGMEAIAAERAEFSKERDALRLHNHPHAALPLFAAPGPEPEAPALTALRAVDPNSLSPRDALDLLFELKELDARHSGR